MGGPELAAAVASVELGLGVTLVFVAMAALFLLWTQDGGRK